MLKKLSLSPISVVFDTKIIILIFVSHKTLRVMADFRIGNGYDIHRLAEGLTLTIGGVKIPHTKGCVAHSDGDVAIHALCDALLGALALGDIGHFFPDTDEAYRGIDSKILLQRVMDLVRKAGYTPCNADITLLLQKPKIAPYIPQMRAALAPLMDLGEDCVSVKATTMERLGPIGAEEGVAAYATILLQKKSEY